MDNAANKRNQLRVDYPKPDRSTIVFDRLSLDVFELAILNNIVREKAYV